MTWLDRLLRDWRIGKAKREIPHGARLLDIGTYDGTLFGIVGVPGVGIDPMLSAPIEVSDGVVLVRGFFPQDLPTEPASSFDAVTALAVIEHVTDGELRRWAVELARLLKPGGVLVITVPSPVVDHILRVLLRLRLVAGMEAHQHHGFAPGNVPRLFAEPQWRLVKHQRFQLGLNNLYVFQRIDRA